MRYIVFMLAAFLLFVVFLTNGVVAQHNPQYGIKIDFYGNSFTSSEILFTGYYPAIDDSWLIFDAWNRMEYEFDPGIGKSIGGAIFYSASNIIELNLGIGYTSIPMDVSQSSRFSFFGSGGYYIYDSYNYQTEKDIDLRYFALSPAILLKIPSSSNVRPYLRLGLDVLFAKMKGSLIFALPYVTQDISYYYLWIGEDAYLVPMEIEGSQTLFAFDVGAGLEFSITPTLDINLSASYLVPLQRAFEDFDEIIQGNDPQDLWRIIGYDFDGLSFANVSFLIGLKFYIQ